MSVKGWFNGHAEPAPIVFAAFDVETDGLGGTLLAGTTTDPQGASRFYSGNPDTICGLMFDTMWQHPATRGTRHAPSHKVIWYAHNAQYDWRYLLKYALKQEDWLVSVSMRSETDIYQVMIKRGSGRKIDTLIMRDSYALFPQTLEQFSSQFAPQHAKIHFDHERQTFDPANHEHRAYAVRDTESLRLSLIAYDATVREDYGIGLRATAASTALAAWQKSLPDGEGYYGSEGEVERIAREAYFGGLVFLTSDDLHADCNTYDINSSYPHQMRTHGVPCGRSCRTTQLVFDLPAFYRVTVRAPDDLVIPILPMRDKRGSVRWPTGVFETTITNIELQLAMENGYDLLAVHDGLLFERIEYPFKNFVDNSEAIRKRNKKTPREVVAKLMQNSVYGKFGSRRERNEMVVLKDTSEVQEGWTPWDEEGLLWIKKELQEDMQVRVEWAAWITACARLHLLKAAYAVGPANVYYGDTDSLTLKRGIHLQTGEAYGEWKLEKQWIRFRPIAPKVYAGCAMTDKGPALMGAAKGLAKKALRGQDWLDLMQGRSLELEYESLNSLLVSLKRKEQNKAKMLTRKSTDIRNSRNYEKRGNNTIRPRKAG